MIECEISFEMSYSFGAKLFSTEKLNINPNWNITTIIEKLKEKYPSYISNRIKIIRIKEV